MSEDCPHCVFNETESDCPGCFEGSHYKPKPSSNADRIRAMSDEELAEWIAEYTDCLCGIHKPGCSKTKGTCVATWLDWLRQEVSDG